MPKIREYRQADRKHLLEIHKRSLVDVEWRTGRLANYLDRIEWPENGSWVMIVADIPVGYIFTERIPGQDGLYEIQGCVDPEHRRRGLGSKLLDFVLEQLSNGGARAASHKTKTTSEPGSIFLLKRGFAVEHVEWRMALTDFTRLPESAATTIGYEYRSFPLQESIPLFYRLYHEAFYGTAWYQPYENHEQIEVELKNPSDIIFVYRDHVPVGFSWLHQETGGAGVIEPIGISRDFQGQGLGWALLRESIERLLARGVMEIKLGVWKQNEIALHLYRKVGFSVTDSITYLEKELQNKAMMS